LIGLAIDQIKVEPTDAVGAHETNGFNDVGWTVQSTHFLQPTGIHGLDAHTDPIDTPRRQDGHHGFDRGPRIDLDGPFVAIGETGSTGDGVKEAIKEVRFEDARSSSTDVDRVQGPSIPSTVEFRGHGVDEACTVVVS
jgi:hypothetical protein